jgi:hypothetical protein
MIMTWRTMKRRATIIVQKSSDYFSLGMAQITRMLIGLLTTKIRVIRAIRG